jgi:hypothetical protein
VKDKLPEILALGIRELSALGQSGAAEVLELLAKLPSPQEIVNLRPSPEFQERISALLEENRTEGLTAVEEELWERYQYLEHLVRLAKAEALVRLQAA